MQALAYVDGQALHALDRRHLGTRLQVLFDTLSHPSVSIVV
jgi:hypothetical protein